MQSKKETKHENPASLEKAMLLTILTLVEEDVREKKSRLREAKKMLETAAQEVDKLRAADQEEQMKGPLALVEELNLLLIKIDIGLDDFDDLDDLDDFEDLETAREKACGLGYDPDEFAEKTLKFINDLKKKGL